jgi:aminocarboxymuconate-semialdehyde decarboxylase
MEPIALDVHAHLVPVLPARLAALPGVAWDGAMTVDGYRLGLTAVYEPEQLIAWMDRNAVARAWVSAPPPLYRLALEEAAAAAWTDYVNDGLAAIGARHGDRLSPMFHLPVQHPALAAAVAVRAIAQGQRRFAMPAGSATQGLVLSDPAYAPLWSALDAARGFLFLHPCKGCDGRLDAFYLHNLLGSPAETALAAAHLAMSGVLDRHPGMIVCLAHGGGAAPAVVGRLTRGQVTGRPGARLAGVPDATLSFRRFCADCITHGAPALEHAARVFGEERILFGSDWPFAMGMPDPHAQMADVAPALRARIFRNDAALICDGG